MRFRIAVVATLLLAACGPGKGEIRTARSSIYQTDFATVWNAVAATVKSQYPRMAIEDAGNGRILTDWHLIERVDFEDGAKAAAGGDGTGAPTSATGLGQQNLPGGRFFRIAVIIKPGGPPWKIEIDGEAALYRPGMAMITPYQHSDADEPPWVRPRIDKIHVGIYRRLKKFAREVKVEQKAPRKPSLAAWANLPEAAAEVIGEVHAAAGKKDTAALRGSMAADFVWSLGSAPGVDAAIAFWDADPHVLSRLRDTLALGCELREATAVIVCPVTADQPGVWRAELRQVAGTWKLSGFYFND